MKKNEVINLIKTKAQEVEIKDLTSNILERVKNISYEEEVKPLPKFRFRPRLAFSASLLSLFLVFIFSLFIYPEMTNQNVAPQFDNMENVLMFSSISTSTLLDTSNTSDLSTYLYDLNGRNNNENQNKIDDELTELTKYFGVMEKLFASKNNFELKVDAAKAGYGESMRFKTKDFLNEETQYEMNLNQNYDETSHQYNIDGELIIGSLNYQVRGKSFDKRLETRTSIDDQNYMDMNYELIDEKHHFDLLQTKEGILIEDVTLIIEEIDNKRIVELYINKEQGILSYTFEMSIESNNRVLKVNYLLGDESLESGELLIRIRENQGENIYSVLVKPDNGTPYQINKGRKSPQK